MKRLTDLVRRLWRQYWPPARRLGKATTFALQIYQLPPKARRHVLETVATTPWHDPIVQIMQKQERDAQLALQAQMQAAVDSVGGLSELSATTRTRTKWSSESDAVIRLTPTPVSNLGPSWPVGMDWPYHIESDGHRERFMPDPRSPRGQALSSLMNATRLVIKQIEQERY